MDILSTFFQKIDFSRLYVCIFFCVFFLRSEIENVCCRYDDGVQVSTKPHEQPTATLLLDESALNSKSLIYNFERL